MTSLIKGFVGSLSDVLDLNQATLSGCIDIIVVEHDDGTRHSTPFHIRFGKLQLLRSREKLVTIYVNGEKTPLTMKLGRAGEAYFYEQFETDTDVEWPGSPMHSPIQSPVPSPEKYPSFDDEIIVQDLIEEMLISVENSYANLQDQPEGAPIPTLPFPDALDLKPQQDRSIDLEFQRSPADSLFQRNECDPDPVVSAEPTAANIAMLSESQANDNGESTDLVLPLSRDLVDNDLLDSPPPLELGSSAEIDKHPSGSADKLWSVWSWGWGSFPVRQLATTSSERYDDDVLDPVIMEAPITLTSSSVPAPLTTPDHPGRSLSWVSSIIGIFRGRSDANTLSLPQTPFVDVRLFVTRSGRVRIQIEPRDIPNLSPTKTDQTEIQASHVEMTSQTNDSPVIAPSNALTPVSHSVELSLCAHLFKSDDATNSIRFRENRITFDRLCSDPAIIYDPNLMVRYQDSFYPGKVALPLILSYLAFGRRLTPEALSKLGVPTPSSLNESEPSATTEISLNELQPAVSASADAVKSSFLYRWFGQDGSSATVKATSTSGSNIPLNASIGNASSQVNDASLAANSDSPEIRPASFPSPKNSSYKTLRPSSDMLSMLDLNFGQNVISFCVESALQGIQVVEGFIYLWPESAKIVISDVDGTITRSDLLGNIMPLMGKDWSQVGVTSFFSNIAANGYNILYLTSRAIGQANVTRTYLSSIKQGAISLPQGPVIMSPDSLISSFKREVIYRRPQEFKIPALRDVANLFPEGVCPFVAGFGNRETDIESYIAVGIPLSMIFIIDPKGSIHRMKSVHRTSYSILNDQVEHMFPPFSKRTSRAHSSFSEFHYWRQPIRSLQDLHLDQQQTQTNRQETTAIKQEQLRVQVSSAQDAPLQKGVIDQPR